MDIIGTIPLFDEPIDYGAVRYRRQGSMQERVQDAVQDEALFAVFVNGILTMQLGCSPSCLVELVVGRLFTEGVIETIDDIDAITVCEESMRADVVLHDSRVPDFSREAEHVVTTCCTNNATLNEYYADYAGLEPVAPVPWDANWVFAIADEFAKDKTAHARTQGAHSAYLADRSGILYMREDIGRHNAFDKVVGAALIGGVDLSDCLLYTSGRVPTDMAVKAVRARIPLLLSKSVATDKAIELAKSTQLTLICRATPASFDVMFNPCAAT